MNETNQGSTNGELAYCIVQFPNTTMTVAPGATVPPPAVTADVYGRFFQSDITPTGGSNTNVRAEVGYGPANQDPFTQFAFYPASFNASCSDCGSNDEWQRRFPAPAVTGNYNVVYRFSADSGGHWTYCDTAGNGANSTANGGGDTNLGPYDPTRLLPLVVQ